MRTLISRIQFHRFQLLTFLVLLFLTLPFAFRETAWSEWANPYWFLVEQTNQVRRFGFPTFFLHSDVSGTAYPNHVFYAGFTIAVMSYLAAIFTPWVIFVFSFLKRPIHIAVSRIRCDYFTLFRHEYLWAWCVGRISRLLVWNFLGRKSHCCTKN